MAENKMAEVARLFGKQLGERFYVKTRRNAIHEYNFTEAGLIYYYGNLPQMNDKNMLQDLLTGKAVIIDE